MSETRTSSPAPDPVPAAVIAKPPPPPPETAAVWEPEKRGPLFWLNPLKWFSKITPESLVRDGQRLIESRSLHQAMAAFQKALEMNPKHAPAHRGLAKVSIARGGRTNLERALTHLDEAVRTNPFDEPSYSLTSLVLDKLGKVEAAQTARRKLGIVRALQLDAANPIANNNMGIVILSQGHPEEAVKYFHKAIEVNRRYDSAFRNLAIAHYQLAMRAPEGGKADHLASAEEAANQALSLSKTVPALLIRARIGVLKGELEVALAAVNEAQVIEPQNKDGFVVKQMVLEKLGRMAEAQMVHEQIQSHIRQET